MNTITSGFIRQCVVAFAMLAALTVILGVAYPTVVWAASRVGSNSAEGSQVTDAKGCNAGSTLIGLDPKAPSGAADTFLHSRVLGSADDPMATGDPAASAASNQGPNSETLEHNIAARRALIAQREGVEPSAVPADAVTGSGSGLDPQISPEYAAIQIPRIARNTGKSESAIREIVDAHTSGRQWGFLGQERVNVLEVNLALGHTACK